MTLKKHETYYGFEIWHKISAHKNPIESRKNNTFQRPKIVEKVQKAQNSMFSTFQIMNSLCNALARARPPITSPIIVYPSSRMQSY
jgi:hypothetical protein